MFYKLILLLLLLCLNVHHSLQIAENPRYITVLALGRTAELGFLYDERTDEFREVNIFRQNIPPDAIKTVQKSLSSTSTALINTYHDQFRLFKINDNAAINILSGLVEIEGGSSSFLKNEKIYGKGPLGVLLYQYQTRRQTLEIYYESLKSLYSLSLLHHKGATHVVTGITWGTQIATTITAPLSVRAAFASSGSESSLNHRSIPRKIHYEFKKFKGSFPTKENDTSNFTISLYSDFSIPATVQPTNYKSFQNLLSQVPQLVAAVNDGWGIPLEFKLTPITVLKEYFKVPLNEGSTNSAVQVDEWVLKYTLSIFDEIASVEDHLISLQNDVICQKFCISSKLGSQFNKLVANFTLEKAKFTSKIKTALIEIRSGKETSNRLSAISEEYIDGEFSSHNIEMKLPAFDELFEKVKFCEMLQRQYPNIEPITSRLDFNAKVDQNLDKIVYVLLQKKGPEAENEPDTNLQNHRENLNTFLNKLYSPYNKLLFLDCDAGFDLEVDACQSINRTVIKQLMIGKVTIEDVHAHLSEAPSSPLETESRTMEAIGRFAKLGQLFDARTDTFLENSLLPSGSDAASLAHSIENNNGETKEILTKNVRERLKALHVDEELQFSILANLFPLARSGKYFQDAILASPVILDTRYKGFEEIRMDDPKVLQSLGPQVIDQIQTQATHFVSKIERGFKSIISFEDQRKNIGHYSGSEPTLGKCIKTLTHFFDSLDVTMGTQPPVYSYIHSNCGAFRDNLLIKVYSDIQEATFEPSTFENIDQLLTYATNKSLPQQTQQNFGKGQPLTYTLYPIERLQRQLGIIGRRIPFGSLRNEDPSPYFEFLMQIPAQKLKIETLSQAMARNICTASTENLEKLNEIRTFYTTEVEGFKEAFNNHTRQIKAGLIAKEVLRNYWTAFQKKTLQFSMELEDLITKNLDGSFLFCQELAGKDIVYLADNDTNNAGNESFANLTSGFRRSYVLYYKPAWTRLNAYKELWVERSQIFLNLTESPEEAISQKLYVVNCEYNYPHCNTTNFPVIHEYRYGKLKTTSFTSRTIQDSVCFQMEKRLYNPIIDGNSATTSVLYQHQTLEVTRLDCSGPNFIDIPSFLTPGASALFEYKPSDAIGNDKQECLWALNNTHNSNVYSFKFKITLICSEFEESENSLSVVTWDYNSDKLSSYELKYNIEYSLSSVVHGLFLNFATNKSSNVAGFLVKIDITSVTSWSKVFKYVSANTMAAGNEKFDFYQATGSTSVSLGIFLPSKRPSTTLTVDYLGGYKHSSCEVRDSLDMYEIRGKRSPNRITRLCGLRTSPASYTTTSHPVIILFYNYNSNNQKGFQISWK